MSSNYTEELKLFDLLTEQCLFNLYNYSAKNNNTIILNDFNKKDKKHLFILEVSLILQTFLPSKIYLNFKNKFEFYLFKIMNKRFRKNIYYTNSIEGFDTEKVLNFILKKNKIKEKQIWDKIYDINFNRKENLK